VREVLIEASWKKKLAKEFSAEYMASLSRFLRREKAAGKVIYPASVDIFTAFKLTPFDRVKVVILGQDPYHRPNQAHGLSFSVRRGIATPPSLQNIYKEMNSDLGTHPPAHGNLENWAKQGVLMLNSVLTVEHGKAGAHVGKGWERFTDAVINRLNSKRNNLVFVLWGRKAQQKGSRVDPYRHKIIMSAHPSPLSAYNGFFGSKPFSKTNNYLAKHNISPINWSL
jgi:uracil-DNA glycosylase